MGFALRKLGYNHCSWHPEAHRMFKLNDDFQVLVPYIDKYDSFDDGPWHDCDFENLDLYYPGSKFIILERDNESWIRSMEYHTSPLFNINNIATQYLRQQWIDDRESYSKELVLWKDKKYRKIKKYFINRPQDLCCLNIKDGWEPLCSFLKKPVPINHFPKKNVSQIG